MLVSTFIIDMHLSNKRELVTIQEVRDIYCSDSLSVEGRGYFATGLEEQKPSVGEVKPTDTFSECIVKEIRAK